MFSWLKSVKKGAIGAAPALPAFLVVRLLGRFGFEVTAEEALELQAFLGALIAFLVVGGKNVLKNRPRRVKVTESETVEDRRRA